MKNFTTLITPTNITIPETIEHNGETILLDYAGGQSKAAGENLYIFGNDSEGRILSFGQDPLTGELRLLNTIRCNPEDGFVNDLEA